MAIPNDPDTLLRRADAASALREAGYPIARATCRDSRYTRELAYFPALWENSTL